MSTFPLPFDSDALRANIATTAQEVVIPDRYLRLVASVEGFHGVRSSLTETLGEYFHTFRNTDALIEGFQTILLRNWSYFERSDDRAEAFELLAELILGLLDEPLTDAQLSSLLRELLMWSRSALEGRHGDAYDDSVGLIGEYLSGLLPDRPVPFLERDVLLRNLVRRASQRPGLAAGFLDLYRELLLKGYRRVAERLDVPEWATTGAGELTDPEAVAGRFGFLERQRLADLLAAAEAAGRDDLLDSGLPLFSDILGQVIDEVFRVENLEDRFAACLYLLKDDTLGHRQNEVMVDLLAVVKQMMDPDRHMDAERILSRLTAFFRDRDNEFLLMRFRCYEAIGVAIGEAGNVRDADHLINDILYWKFQYPEISGATDEWETVVNPFHLPKIRTWMHIIESNPALYERLAAALNVQLRLGGVYIADTDLFQRDVTQFLNADIRPIYFVAKQLLRTLPVYFNEVGAEGELRSVSTEMDELSNRHDTLVHFLRKQSHTESSNRLLSFTRAALRYWLTHDPAGLRPYLSVNTLTAVEGQPEWAAGPHRVLAALHQHWSVQTAGGHALRPADEPSGVGGGEVPPEAADGSHHPGPEGAGGRAPDDPRTATAAGDQVAAADEFLDWLLALSPAALRTRLVEEDVEAADGVDERRVALLVRMYQLLEQKYSLSAHGVGDAVGRHLHLAPGVREAFGDALADWQGEPTPSTRDALLDAALTVLEELKAIVLAPEPSAPTENIYRKRHIAAGIPSIYGNYSEPKFDALGLSFRVESLVGRLFDDLAAEGIEPYITRDSLRRMTAAIRRFERALAVDGVDSRALGANLNLLDASFSSHNFTFHQYQNVFQFLANSVTELSTTSVLSHDQVMHTVLIHDPRQCEARGMSVDAVAEMLLREVLVSALGMQDLDRYVAAALRQISMLHGRLSGHALTRMMNYDPERLVSPIHEPRPGADEQMSLGFKGLGLKQMSLYGHRVPQGFVLTTELFDARPAMSYRPLYEDTIERIGAALADLERQTALRLGDRKRLLLVSIRSGAAISMPGLMTTFVNVGLNDLLAEELSKHRRFEWAAWDAYRRFLQSWAMSCGIDRDFFDAIMGEFKSRYGVERKLDFSPDHMREIAFAYKQRAREVGVVFIDDPFRQVVWCVRKVLESWDTDHARLYREYTGIAEEWGTAVVVQRMIFGNLSRLSGSGVTFTNNPLEPHSRQVRLFGDYAVRSQGEDLVGGLVFPLPISEAQRMGSPTYRGTQHSLERDFPDVYRELLSVARDLVAEREYDPQEIEFTFESPAAKDLYILQKRAVVQEHTRDAAYFDTGSPAYGPPAAVGMGVAGGAYSGRIAINAAQIDELEAETPEEHIVLLRPDTVPDDIAMITRVSAILTARGGATSHAAVTAKRLGKTAVVDCEDLEVVEHEGLARLAGNELRAGDWLSIDGRTGNIFLGRIPTRTSPTPPEPR